MFRLPIIPLAAVVGLSLAACGGVDHAGVTPEAAKTSVERAAHLELAPEPVPADAHEQGLRASYSNAGTRVKDRQVVGLFVMKDAGVADKVSDLVRSSAPSSAQLIRHGAVLVVYAPAGSDRSAAIERAVDGL